MAREILSLGKFEMIPPLIVEIQHNNTLLLPKFQREKTFSLTDNFEVLRHTIMFFQG